MITLLKYLKEYKKESILGPFFKLLEASFELIVPLVMAGMIDYGIKNKDVFYIGKNGAILLVLGIIGLICSVTAQYYAAKASSGFGTTLREKLFVHYTKLSYSDMDLLGTSTMLTRITSDINQVQTGVNMVLRLFLRSPFIVFGAMVMAFTISVRAAIVFTIVIPGLACAVFFITFLSIPLYKKLQNQLEIILLQVRENLIGVRVIRAFNRQSEEKAHFLETNQQFKKMQLFVGRISGLLNPITYIMINFAVIAVIWIGGKEVNTGVLSQGEVVALVNYMSQILVELIKLANLFITFNKTIACGNRINDILSMDVGMIEGNNSKKTCFDKQEAIVPVLEMREVSFSYAQSNEKSLDQISFKAGKGEVIGIIGSTGSGKTTLVNLVPRFYQATQGTVFVDGMDVKDYSYQKLREKIGVVPQKAVLFSGTIRENMYWGKKDATEEEIKYALDSAQASEIIEQKEAKLDSKISQNGKNLSGGQRQRLTIARSLVKTPRILILDDSASALDFATDAKLRHSIKENYKETTVLLVSQRVTTVKNADQIIVLEDGKMVGIGTHEELMVSCQVYEEICLSQLSSEEVHAR